MYKLFEEYGTIDYILDRYHAIFNEEVISNIEDVYEFGYFTERSSSKTKKTMKEFFSRIIASIQTLIREIQIKIDSAVREKGVTKNLSRLKLEMKVKKEIGAKKVEMMDVWKYQSIYIDMNSRLWKYIQRFTKMDYTSTKQIDRDLRDYESIVETYQGKLEDISENKIEVPIEKAMQFVDDNLNGNSKVIKTLNETITEFKRMEQLVENIKIRKTINGEDIIPKKIWFIERMLMRFVSFVKRQVVKFVTTVVFIFA